MLLKTFLDKRFYDLFVRSTRNSVICGTLLSRGLRALSFLVLRLSPGLGEI